MYLGARTSGTTLRSSSLNDTFRIPVLVGPTCVGKTAQSISAAKQLDAEIVSCDSRQIYRQLNAGTAKPSALEQRTVPHHFINELDLGEHNTAGMFAESAEDRISDIISRDKIPLIVGGSTLYLHALIRGLANIPTVRETTRAQMASRLKGEGLDALFEELQQVDAAYARTLDKTKSQRILRGLEVFHDTGRPISYFFENNRAKPKFKYHLYVMQRDRSDLYRRINARVDQMLASGLVEEVAHLKAAGWDLGTSSLRTIGYREVFGFLDRLYDRSEMIRLIKRNTRRYAKRQVTWFRQYPDASWIAPDHQFADDYLAIGRDSPVI